MDITIEMVKLKKLVTIIKEEFNEEFNNSLITYSIKYESAKRKVIRRLPKKWITTKEEFYEIERIIDDSFVYLLIKRKSLF